MNCYHWNGFSHIARRRRAAVVSTCGGANGDNIIVCHIIIIISCYIQCDGPALDITGNNNNNVTDYNIVAISTTTGTNNSSSTPSSNMTETIPMITVHDVINSTYIAPKEADENESERRIGRAIRDRVNDIFHTVVMSNATIISTARITNGFLDESATINNYTRLLEVIPDPVRAALAGIRAISQPANPLLELHRY